MKIKTPALLLGLLTLAALLTVFSVPAAAQIYYQTPTPGADGRIVYKVQQNDTCTSIALKNNITMDQLTKLNDLKGDCTLQVGQELLIALVEVVTPTIGPTVTPTRSGPTPTPFNGNGQICVLLYTDLNGNAMAETGETTIAGGAISITDRQGKVSLTGTSTGSNKPVCFENVPEGEYNVSVAVPEGFNPTTTLNYALTLKAGDQTTLDFGAQLSSNAQPAPTASESNNSPLLAILGGVLLVGGVALAIYFRSLRRMP